MNATADTAFGPQLEGSFDFTLLFEQSILSILPSGILLLVLPVRIALLARREPNFKAGPILWAKLIPILALFGLQLANLALWSLTTPHSGVAVAAAVLSLADVVALGALLYTEHRYSYSPSLLLSIYLSITLLFDIAHVRSLFLLGDLVALGGITSTVVAVKLLIIVLEEIPKRGLGVFSTSKELSSGWWNRSVFWWLNSTFRKGFTSFLQVDDLAGLDRKLDSHRAASKLNQKWKSVDTKGKYCLAIAIFYAYQSTFWAAIIPRLCFTGFSFAQPFLINTLIDIVGAPRPEGSQAIVGGLVGATALIYLGIAFSKCHYMHYTFRLMTSVRGGLVALIFAKAVDLDAAVAKDTAAVTLMSTDIDGLTSGLQKIHDIWASVIELGIAIYLLQRQIGAACFLTLIPAVLSSFATGRLARGMGPARMAWNAMVQKRVSTTSSTLDQIKGIKMMGLSGRISHLIQSLRVTELNTSKAFRMFFVWLNLIANLADQLTPTIVIAAAVFWTQAGQNFTVAQAFTSLSIVALVSTPVVNIIAAYPSFVACLACCTRIQTFLLSDERHDYRSVAEKYRIPSSDRDSTSKRDGKAEAITKKPGLGPVIHIENASFSLKEENEAVLRDINISIPTSGLTMIVGPVGSGKSALLKAVLGEARLLSGRVRLESSPVAYCDQAAWMRWGSIRDNILGPKDFEQTWYQEVLHACALNDDISQLEDGDQSLVGSAGTALSGGQKQRVALARAVYARAPIVLLDDVFSSLDRPTSLDVFNRLLGREGILRRKDATILLATHAVNYLSSADNIIMLEEGGKIVQQGTYDELRSTEGFVKILGSQGAMDQPAASESPNDKPEEDKAQSKTSTPSPGTSDLTRKTGDLSLYKFYLQSVGSLMFIGWLVLAAGYIFSGKLPQIWLRIWTENGTSNHAGAYFGGYIGFGLLCAAFSGLCMYYYMIVVVPKSAQHLHWLLLDAVLKAPLWFFTTTDTSTILNRFSQDMTLVDQVLPVAVFTTTFDVYNVIAGAALVASGATYVAAVIPFCALAIYAIQKFYLRTSRQMRHLDLEAKSPLYRQFTETAAGIITVRAFGWKGDMTNEHMRQLDHSQKPYYMMFCIQRWLNVVLDLVVAAIAIVLVGFAVGFSNTATQGSIGLAMLNLMDFSQSLSMLINSWTGLETSLGAIARLKSFLAETKSEDQENEDQTPPADWLQSGSVELAGVTAKYNINDTQSQPALRDITLSLRPGQTVSITGRTGSGKTSLLLTLLHLLDLEAGRLTLDGRDAARIPRAALRARIVTIPQDAVALPGSVRFNLAQFDDGASGSGEGEAGGGHEDEAMRAALARVGLWDTLSKRGGLDGELGDAGLSGGQKQLFSLARAILAAQGKGVGGGVVLLDEPTSSVGEDTDEEMRRIVREEFAGYTVITVSHRLDAVGDAVGDADVVVRMAGGKVVEVTRKGE